MSKETFTIEFAMPKTGDPINTPLGEGVVDKVEGDKIFVTLERIHTTEKGYQYNYVTVEAVPKVAFKVTGHA